MSVAITTARIKETTVQGHPVWIASIAGAHGHFTDAFASFPLADAWAVDVLVAYFGHTVTEAKGTIATGMIQEAEQYRCSSCNTFHEQHFACPVSYGQQCPGGCGYTGLASEKDGVLTCPRCSYVER